MTQSKSRLTFWLVVFGGALLFVVGLGFVVIQFRRLGLEPSIAFIVVSVGLLVVLAILLSVSLLTWPRAARLIDWAHASDPEADLYVISPTVSIEQAARVSGLRDSRALVLTLTSNSVRIWRKEDAPPILDLPWNEIVRVDSVRATTVGQANVPGARFLVAGSGALDVGLTMNVGPILLFPTRARAERIVNALSNRGRHHESRGDLSSS